MAAAAKRVKVEDGLWTQGSVYKTRITSAGQSKFITVGKIADLNLTAARRLAEDKRSEARNKPSSPVAKVKAAATMKDLWEDFEAKQASRNEVESLRDGSLRNHRESWNLHIGPVLGKRRCSAMDADVLVDWLAKMGRKTFKRRGVAQRYSAATVHRHFRTLGQILKYGVRHGYLASNPCEVLESDERPSSGKARERSLSADEIKRLMLAVDPKYALALKLALRAGLGIGEIVQLTWGMVNLGAAEITPDGVLKTEARHGTVVIDHALAKDLRDHKSASEFTGDDDPVLASSVGTPIAMRNLRRRGLEAAIGRAGIAHCTFHDLRRTFGSIMISQGADIAWVTQQMRHADSAVTLKVYVREFGRQRHADQHREAMGKLVAAVS